MVRDEQTIDETVTTLNLETDAILGEAALAHESSGTPSHGTPPAGTANIASVAQSAQGR